MWPVTPYVYLSVCPQGMHPRSLCSSSDTPFVHSLLQTLLVCVSVGREFLLTHQAWYRLRVFADAVPVA